MKVRLISGEDTAKAQQAAWPSLETPAAAGAAASPVVPLPKEPQVELARQPDGSSRIVVTCACGRRIEITCEA